MFKTLSVIKIKNPELFSKGVSFKSYMDFNRNWGLGSSSSLINNLASGLTLINLNFIGMLQMAVDMI